VARLRHRREAARGGRRSQRKYTVAAAAPTSCAAMKPGASAGRMPAEGVARRPREGHRRFANEVDEVNQYAAVM